MADRKHIVTIPKSIGDYNRTRGTIIINVKSVVSSSSHDIPKHICYVHTGGIDYVMIARKVDEEEERWKRSGDTLSLIQHRPR